MGGSLFGGGGGGSSGTTTNLAPGNLQGPAGIYLHSLLGNVQNDLNQGPPPNLYTQVAPFNPFQTQGLNFIGNTLPGLYNGAAPSLQNAYSSAAGYLPAAQQAANVGANQLETFARGGNQTPNNPTLQAFANGQFAGPNPYLNQYYNQAANQLTQQYQLGTQPALMAEFQQAGAFNSPGFNQAQGLAQSQFGNSLATLGADIYEPAYQQGMQNMLTAGQGLQQNAQFNTGNQLAAAQGLPAAAAGMFAPGQALAGLAGQTYGNLYNFANQTGQGLYNAGAGFQQQQQNLNNALQSNAALSTNWPFALLGQLGAGLGVAGMGQGQSIATGNNGGGGGNQLLGSLIGLGGAAALAPFGI